MTSMQESSMKGVGLSRNDEANQKHGVVIVEGFDLSLQAYLLELMLRKHFSSCGNITGLEFGPGPLESSVLVFFDEISAVDKALELSGSYSRGWKIVVARGKFSDYVNLDDDDDVYDDEEEYDDDHIEDEYDIDEEEEEEEKENENEKKNEKEKEKEKKKEKEKEKKEEEKEREMYVYGIDDSAPELDVMIKLCEHFSSCGEVTNVRFMGRGNPNSRSRAIVSICGKDATEKAKNLNGRAVDGENFVVGGVLLTGAELFRLGKILPTY